MDIDEIKGLAEKRGYAYVYSNGDYSRLVFINKETRLNLEVWVNSKEFCISYVARGFVELTSNKVGNFESDKQFSRVELFMQKYALAIQSVE